MKSNALLLVVVLVLAGAAALFWYGNRDDRTGIDYPLSDATAHPADGPERGEPASTATADDAGLDRTEVAPPPTEALPAAQGETPDSKPKTGRELRARGRVVDARGNGLANARVAVADRQIEALPFAVGGIDDLMAIGRAGEPTDAEGYFDVELEEPGKFRLIASHAEHPSSNYRGEATADIEGIVIELRDGATISGRVLGKPDSVTSVVVLAKKSQRGIANAAATSLIDLGSMVDAIAPGVGLRTDVDEAGAFELRGLDPREHYSVWAANADDSVSLPVKSTLAVEFAAGTQGIELHWREPLRVRLQVTTAENATPIEHLDVRAGFVKEMKMLGMAIPMPITRPLPQHEFPGGVLKIDGLEIPEDERPVLAIEIRAAGREPWIRHDLEVPRSGHADLGTAQLARAPIVIATVLDGRTGSPIDGATVALHEVEDEADEDSNQGGNRSISLSTSMSTPEDRSVDDPTTALVEDLNANRMTGTTDESGQCRLTAEFRGPARVRVELDGWAPAASEQFETTGIGETPIEVRLFRGGTVRVTTVDGHGKPAPNAIVKRAGPIPEDSDDERSDEHGRITFEGLAVGEHTFKLIDVDADSSGPIKVALTGIMDPNAGEKVQVADGATTDLQLAFPLYGKVTGHVTLDGQPLDQAKVQLFTPGDNEEEAAAQFIGSMLGGLVELGAQDESDVDGYFELNRVAAGPYRLVVQHKLLAMPSAQEFEVIEGDNRAEIALVSTTLRGRVVDSSGNPVPRATIGVMANEGRLSDLTDQLGDAQEMLGALFGGKTGGPASVRTAADGTFELRGVRPDTPLLVSAKARLHVQGSAPVAPLTAGSTRENIEVVLQPAGRVRVSAVGVRGALSVELEWAGPQGPNPPREREGLLKRSRATIDGLLPGTWRVTLSGMGIADDIQPRTIEIQAGKTARVDFGR